MREGKGEWRERGEREKGDPDPDWESEKVATLLMTGAFFNNK